MKRKLIVSILGAAASSAMVASSYGQGQILFANYEPADGASAVAPVTFGANPPSGEAGFYVGSEFTAELVYQYAGMTGAASPISGFDAATSSLGAAALTPFLGTDSAANTVGGAGYFSFTDPNTGSSAAIVPGYTTGAVTFEVYAFGTVNSVSYTGVSSPFVVPSPLATAANGNAPGDLFNNGNGLTVGGVLTPFSVVPTPEPTTLALGGLGAAALLALRRRK